MTHSDMIARVCAAAPVIPVLTIDRVEDAQPLARALVAGGLPALEITLRTDAALEAIAAIAEVEGAHYVFDHDDIYIHDTHTRQSICDERVKTYIFGGLNTAKSDRCFVHHNPELDEVMFCYVSGDDMAEYTNGDRCNRAAVFNLSLIHI